MVNSQQVWETVDALKLDLNTEKIPQPVAVVETNPKIVKRGYITNAVGTNSTSTIIKTWSSTSDTFITGAVLTVVKDATSTSTYEDILCVIDGINTSILKIASLTLTAQHDTVSITFPHPIKVDRGTASSIRMATNVANCTVCGMISYFTDDVN